MTKNRKVLPRKHIRTVESVTNPLQVWSHLLGLGLNPSAPIPKVNPSRYDMGICAAVVTMLIPSETLVCPAPRITPT